MSANRFTMPIVSTNRKAAEAAGGLCVLCWAIGKADTGDWGERGRVARFHVAPDTGGRVGGFLKSQRSRETQPGPAINRKRRPSSMQRSVRASCIMLKKP